MAQKKKMMKKLATRLPEDLLAKLRASVDEQGTKLETAFAEAVRLYLKSRAA